MAHMTLVESRTGEVVFAGVRVTPRQTCPVCGHGSWCLVDGSRGLAICPRVESKKPIGEAGWMHSLGGDMPQAQKFTRPSTEVEPLEGAEAMQARFLRQAGGRLSLLALSLGVSLESLERLGAGWNGSAWTFPMRNHAGYIAGFRTRLENGQKLAIKGSRSGLFIPQGARRDEVWIVEGPTDVAAMLDMGLNAIGRPSCRGSEQEIARWTRSARMVVIVADNDEVGIAGAHALDRTIRGSVQQSLIVVPPMRMKDAREVANHGGTKSDWMALIGATRSPRNSNGLQA